jgi:hypothetical protein
MQSTLEAKAIKKRIIDQVSNQFGIDNEYDISDAKKGGEGTGSISDHTLTSPDFSTGGGEMDINGNPSIPYSGRLGNTLINTYKEGYGYSTDVTIDTSLNVGQVIIN